MAKQETGENHEENPAQKELSDALLKMADKIEADKQDRQINGVAEMKNLIEASKRLRSLYNENDNEDPEDLENKIIGLMTRLMTENSEPKKPNIIQKNIFLKRKSKFEEGLPDANKEDEKRWNDYVEALSQGEKDAIKSAEDWITYSAFKRELTGTAAYNSWVNEDTPKEMDSMLNMAFAASEEEKDQDFDKYIDRLLRDVDTMSTKPVDEAEQKRFEELKGEYKKLEDQLAEIPFFRIDENEIKIYNKIGIKIKKAVPIPEGYWEIGDKNKAIQDKWQKKRDKFVENLSPEEQGVLKKNEENQIKNKPYWELKKQMDDFWRNAGGNFEHYYIVEQQERVRKIEEKK